MGGPKLQINPQQLTRLNQFANSAYGVKFGHGKKGGHGVMMLDGGRVVKTRTSWFKSLVSTTKNTVYQEKTQDLRRMLGQILIEIRRNAAETGVPLETREAVTRLLGDLGLDEKGETVLRPFSKKLLSRKTVAKVLNKLDDLTGASVKGKNVASVWGNAAETATSLGTYVETVGASPNNSFQGEGKKVVAPGKKRLKSPIEVDEATANAVEKEFNTVWAKQEKPQWDQALSSWTLKTVMAEKNVVAALQKLDPTRKFTDEEARILQKGFESQKTDWRENVPLWNRFSSVTSMQLGSVPKPDFGTVKSKQTDELAKFFTEAYEASQMKDVRKDVDWTQVRGQTTGGNTCPIISMLNAMLIANPESNKAALNILKPKTVEGKPVYEFPGDVRVDVNDVKEEAAYPENLPDDKNTGRKIWPELSEFERAALVAVNQRADLEVVPGKTFELFDVFALFGKGYPDIIGRLQSGVAPKGEFELHAAEIARKLAAGKACVLRSQDHFVAITAVTFDPKTHEPIFSVAESVGGPYERQVSRHDLTRSYQLYAEA